MKRMTMTLKGLLVAGTFALAAPVSGLAANAGYTLAEDETWTAAEVETKMTGVIDLNGHTLTVPELKGDATITDTVNLKYELLKSITSTGTQYIDTRVTGKSGLTASADFALAVTGNADHFILGAKKTVTGSGDYFCMLGYTGLNRALVYYDSYSVSAGGDKIFTVGSDYHVTASAVNGNQTMSVGGGRI